MKFIFPGSRAGRVLHRDFNNKLLRTVDQTIAAYRMLQHGDSVLVGVSGGPDSVALLFVLLAYIPRFSLRLGIAHLNHGLRGEHADKDAEFVASLARTLGLPYHMGQEDVRKYQREHRLSMEEAARHVRYTFYDKVAKKNRFNKVALGHHADDNAELVLMYLLRGSGLSGLSGIPPVREGKFVRPLIRLKKSEIKEFLAENRLKYVSDMTNTDTKHLRNRIRHHLMPILKASYNPQITDTLNRLASIVGSEDEWIESVADAVFEKARVSAQKDGITALSVPKLNRMHIATQRRVIRKAIHQVKGNLRHITYTHAEAISNLLEKGPEFGSLDLPGRIRAERKNDRLIFTNAENRNLETNGQTQAACCFQYSVAAPGTLFIKETGMCLKFSQTDIGHLPDLGQTHGQGPPKCDSGMSFGQTIGHFDMDALDFPITVRNFRPGDRFTPLGMTGTQKVKKYFINNKVPREERARCPILLFQDKIIWIAGHRADDAVKVTGLTRNVLKVELFLA